MKQVKHTEFAKLAEKALVRAAARARTLSEQTGTPLIVGQNGKVVDISKQVPSSAARHSFKP